jgi:hypothetical protein
MAWIGTNLITVGTRHVKVWRIDSSTPSTPIKAIASFLPQQSTKVFHKILSGRNCLLGPLLEGTFTAIVTISSSKAIVCSESGDVCLLDDSEGNQQFTKVLNVGFSITAASLCENDTILLAGKGGRAMNIKIEQLLKGKDLDTTEPSSGSESPSSDGSFIVALAPIRLLQQSPHGSSDPTVVSLQLPAHGGSVLGVRPFAGDKSLQADFFTWSADGTILFWATDGSCKHSVTVELEQTDGLDEALNELKVVRLCSNANALVTGDKFGVLRYVNNVQNHYLSRYLHISDSLTRRAESASQVCALMQARSQILPYLNRTEYSSLRVEGIGLCKFSTRMLVLGICFKHWMSTWEL